MAIEFKLPVVLAHRGASLEAPENTLASIKAAAEAGAHWVELDVQLTRDDEVVVIHDDTVNRTTDGKGRIQNFPFSEIQQLDAGSWFGDEFANERVPSLVQCIKLAAHYGIALNIELKGLNRSQLLIEKTVQIVKEHRSQSMPPVLYSSASFRNIKYMQSVAIGQVYALIFHYWPYYFPATMTHSSCVSVHINHKILNAQRVARLRKQGKLVFAYTVNELALAESLLEMGVNGIFSDNMQLLALGT